MNQSTKGKSTMTRKATIATLVFAGAAAIGSAIPALAQETESTTVDSYMGGQDFPTNHEDMEKWMTSDEHQDWMSSPEHTQLFNEMHDSIGSIMGDMTGVSPMMGSGSSPMTGAGWMGRQSAQ